MLQYESELEISRILVEWYETYKRELPWRETRDPYIIWISEIILQQTRVVQGLEYFLRFTERFPMTGSGKIQKFKLKDVGLELCRKQGIEII